MSDLLAPTMPNLVPFSNWYSDLCHSDQIAEYRGKYEKSSTHRGKNPRNELGVQHHLARLFYFRNKSL